MKTSERTLLQQMAFADPDRSPERRHMHDMAVRFLMQPEIAFEVFKRALPKVAVSGVYETRREGRSEWDKTNWNRGPADVEREPEHVLRSSSGFVVGFVDLLLALGTPNPGWNRVAVEVKVEIDDPGAVVRQVKLYNATLSSVGVVACVRPTHASAIEIIRSAGITFIQLGPKFQEFLKCGSSEEADLIL
jgi:hypothetical protein